MNPTLAGYFAMLVEAFGAEEPDLTSRQSAVLICVSMERDLSTGGISARTSIPKPAVTRAIDALEQYGLAYSRKGHDDFRLCRVNITTAGRAYLERQAERLKRIAA